MAGEFDFSEWNHNDVVRKLDADTGPASLSSRYGPDRAAPAASPEPKTFDELAAGEKALQDDIGRGGETVAGYAVSFANGPAARLKSLLATGAWAEAVAEDDSHSAMRDANRSGFLKASLMGGYGATGQRVAEASDSFLQGRYYQDQIVLRDGTQTTVGKALEDARARVASGEQGFEVSLGVDSSAAGMYASGSPAQRKALGLLLDRHTGRAPATGVTNTSADNDRKMANEVAARWDELSSAFGEDGVSEVVGYVAQATKATDDGRDLLKALSTYAKAFGGSPQDLVQGYDRLLQATMKPDLTADGKVPGQYIPTAEDRLKFNSMVLPAVAVAAGRMGSRFSFNDPTLQDTCSEVADTLAWLKASKVDIYGLARKSGVDLNAAFGNYIANRVDGVPNGRPGLPERGGQLRMFVTRQMRGGNDFAESAFRRTGQASDYRGSVARSQGGWSSNPTADALSASLGSAITGALALPVLIEGKPIPDACREIMADPESRRALIGRFRDEIVPYMPGEGGDEAASYLASVLVGQSVGSGVLRLPLANGQALTSQQPGSFQDVVAACIHTPGLAMSEDARRCLVRMYVRDVGRADRFSEERRVALNSVRRAVGGDDRVAAVLMAQVDGLSDAAAGRGMDPATPYVDASHLVNVMLPDPQHPGGFRRFFGDARKSGFDFSADPWEREQQLLALEQSFALAEERRKADEKLQNQLKAAEGKAKISTEAYEDRQQIKQRLNGTEGSSGKML